MFKAINIAGLGGARARIGRPRSAASPSDAAVVRMPYFDAGWYLRRYQDVAAAKADPYEHYLKHGRLERRTPGPYFDIDHYLGRYGDELGPDADPLEHYVRQGWREGFDPNPYFDTEWYRSTQIAAKDDVEPLEHYLKTGWKQGLRPNAYFWPRWYLANNKDVALANIEPLNHYLTFGFRENRDPSPYFDVSWYLEENADISGAGIEPLLHYMTHGHAEAGRNPNPYFDSQWYRAAHAEEVEDKDDPLQHYIDVGFRKGYAPSQRFDPAFYRSRNPNLSDDQDPLAHFLEFGRIDGLSPHPNEDGLPDRAISQWAQVNGLTSLRRSLLSGAIGVPDAGRDGADRALSVLRKAIVQADAVSFDIFDTLVERRSGRPETVFALMAQNNLAPALYARDFVAMRMRAERLARDQAGATEVTLADIYDKFGALTDADDAICRQLADAESQLEIRLCEAKPVGISLFKHALASGLRVFLLSDIYLDRATVEAILAKAGVDGYEALLISSELGARKHDGSLYDLLLKQTGLDAGRIVHIGDNAHSDGAMARNRGLKTLHLQRSDAMVGSPVIGAWLTCEPKDAASRWTAIVAGEIARREGHARTDGHGRSLPQAARLAGASALGPAMLAFAQFVARRARLSGHQRLFFASRDGFYLKEAYDCLRASDPDLPPSTYLLASRRVCRAAGIRSVEDIIAVADVDHFPMSVNKLLAARFLLDDSDRAALPVPAKDLDHVVMNSRTDGLLKGVLERCAPQILAACGSHADAYKSYLAAIGIGSGRDAIVDIGYRGTIQRIISELTGTRLSGIYFITWPEVARLLSDGLRFDAFIASPHDASEPVVRYVQLFELMFSGTHGSVMRFATRDGEPTPITRAPDTSPLTRETLNHLRAGALSFVEEMCGVYPDLVRSHPVDGRTAIAPLVDLFQSPPAVVVEGLRQHRFEDDFGGETRALVTPPDGTLSYKEAIEASSWREGTASLWRAYRNGSRAGDMPVTLDMIDRFQGGDTMPGFRETHDRAYGGQAR